MVSAGDYDPTVTDLCERMAGQKSDEQG